MRNWLVVANAARARVFEDPGDGAAPCPVADLVHTPSRQKGIELASDRPGYVKGVGHGLGSASYVPRTDAHEREHEHFAREVAALLNRAVADGRCAGLIVAASSPFLGELKSHLGVQATKVLLRTVAADYTMLRDDEIAQRLHAPPGA